MSRYAWMDAALCAQSDPDQWTDPGGPGQTPKRICGRCPVQAACGAHADQLHGYDGLAPAGIWGGRSKQQRRAARGEIGDAA